MTDDIDLTSVPASPEEAKAAIESLRDGRLADKVTQADYIARFDYLSRIAAGETDVTAPPSPYETPEQQLARQWNEDVMAPGERHEYDLPAPVDEHGNIDPELQAIDTAVRDAMSDAGIPAQWGGQLVEIANNLLARFADGDAGNVQSHTEHVGSELRGRWGEDFDDNVQAVNDLLADVAENHPIIGVMLDERPFVFADPWAMEHLLMVAKHRKEHRRA